MGDYLYCERHPSVPISNGLFDAPCSACEGEQDEAWEAWQYDPANDQRPYCKLTPYIPHEPRYTQARTCQDVEDDIPF